MDIAKLHFLDTFGLDSIKVTVYRSTNGYYRYLFGHILSIFQRNDYGKTIWVPKTCHGHQKMVIYPLNVEWVYIKLKVSWLRAFLWCMSQTSRDRDNSRRVRTREKNLGDVFLCPVRSLHPLESLEMVQSPRRSSALTWKLSSRLFSRPNWLPLDLRGCIATGVL